jgi:hypothetical protein
MLQKKSRYIINLSDLDLALIDLKYKWDDGSHDNDPFAPDKHFQWTVKRTTLTFD